MANALAFTARMTGENTGACDFSNGAGAGDTIANAELIKLAGGSTTSRIYAFLSRVWTDQAELDGAIAALGVLVTGSGIGSDFYLITGGGAACTATVTSNAGGTGIVKLSLAHSLTA